jgi:Subtilase family
MRGHFCVSDNRWNSGCSALLAHNILIVGAIMCDSPGTSIKSAWSPGTTATNTLSGTSMATPFGTGVAALYLERDPTMTPAEVAAAMTADGSAGVVQNEGSFSPNILLTTFNIGSNASTTTQQVSSPTSAPNTCAVAFTPCESSSNSCCSGYCLWGYCSPF